MAQQQSTNIRVKVQLDGRNIVWRYNDQSKQLSFLNTFIHNGFNLNAFSLEYEDDENDRVLISNDDDLKDAFNIAQEQKRRSLKIYVCTNTNNADDVEAKTSLDDIDAGKMFVYQSDFDTNGILYALGSSYGDEEWSNPAVKGFVTVTSNGWHYGNDNILNVVGRKFKGSCCTKNVAHSWFCVDFGANIKIKPSAYTLRHDAHGAGHVIRTWNFEGSNDGKHWKTLKGHESDSSLNNVEYATHTWTVDHQSKEPYQMFRIYMVGINSSSEWWLMCAGFEIYGCLMCKK
eukprot:158105_1